NNLLSKNQFGFQNKRSCEMALLDLYSCVTTAIDSGKIALGVFIDIQKAFDCVPYDILIHKLKFYGFNTASCNLINSFLTGRTQCTKVNNSLSPSLPVLCGIPQGTVLGPILFLLYINDFLHLLNGKTTSYADDTSLIYVGSNVDSVISVVNSELALAADWFTANKLMFNVNKTQFIVFKTPNSKVTIPENSISVNNLSLTEVKSVRCLGVIFSSNMSWTLHIDHILSRLSYVLAVLYKLKRSNVPSSVLLTVYKGLFLPYIDYSNLVWGPMIGISLIRKLQVMQNKACRLIFSLPLRYSDILSTLHGRNLLSISERIYFNISLFAFNLVYGYRDNFLGINFVSTSDTHNYHTRSAANSNLFIQRTRTLYARNFISNKLILTWNSIPSNIREQRSFPHFKKLLSQYLISSGTQHLS